MKIGYARVSTRGQDLKGQVAALKNEQCDRIYKEKMTGRTTNRPEFQKVLKELQAGDTLLVTKLDRFARSTQEALMIIKELFERDVKIDILNLGRIENSPTGRLIFTVFSAFADFERDLIVERTQEGKVIAKQNPNFKEGRPKKFTEAQLDHALSLLNTHSYKQVQELTGVSKTTLWRYRASQKEKVFG